MAKILMKIDIQCLKCCTMLLYLLVHGGFLEGVYEIELDTKTEYEGF
jgi:hypothetical protein